jgi:hypothetical protein
MSCCASNPKAPSPVLRITWNIVDASDAFNARHHHLLALIFEFPCPCSEPDRLNENTLLFPVPWIS